MVAAMGGPNANVWDLHAEKCIRQLNLGEPLSSQPATLRRGITCLQQFAHDDLVVAGCSDGSIALFDLRVPGGGGAPGAGGDRPAGLVALAAGVHSKSITALRLQRRGEHAGRLVSIDSSGQVNVMDPRLLFFSPIAVTLPNDAFKLPTEQLAHQMRSQPNLKRSLSIFVPGHDSYHELSTDSMDDQLPPSQAQSRSLSVGESEGSGGLSSPYQAAVAVGGQTPHTGASVPPAALGTPPTLRLEDSAATTPDRGYMPFFNDFESNPLELTLGANAIASWMMQEQTTYLATQQNLALYNHPFVAYFSKSLGVIRHPYLHEQLMRLPVYVASACPSAPYDSLTAAAAVIGGALAAPYNGGMDWVNSYILGWDPSASALPIGTTSRGPTFINLPKPSSMVSRSFATVEPGDPAGSSGAWPGIYTPGSRHAMAVHDIQPLVAVSARSSRQFSLYDLAGNLIDTLKVPRLPMPSRQFGPISTMAFHPTDSLLFVANGSDITVVQPNSI